jgi:hypothetical protein
MSQITYTSLLYAQPSFWDGFGRVLDLGRTYDSYNDSCTPAEADYTATASDWYAAGSDLRDAISRYALRCARHHGSQSATRAG